MRLKDKVAVVTGAGSGMGKTTALLFAAQGARIVVGDWNETTMAEVVAEIRENGGKAVGIKGNMAVKTDAEAVVARAIAEFGRIDVLMNNAGVMDTSQGVGEVSDEMWERVIGIDLNGPMYASRKAVQAMLAQGGGSIINVASVAGFGGGAAGAAYTAAKHGLVGLTRSTAWMYAQKGIRCNAICPGGVETNIVQSIDPTKMDPFGAPRNGVYHGIMPGMLQGIDIANLALFLASDESRYINGAIIPADFGWRAA